MNDFVFLYNKTSEILYNICFVLAMNSARKTAKVVLRGLLVSLGQEVKKNRSKELTNKDLFLIIQIMRQ